MADFLAENNVCGQTILHLVAHGNAIIAEILRLKDHIPPVFRLLNKADQQKYSEILFDFNYFRNEENLTAKIESSDQLHELDDEFKETYVEIIIRFYLAFESIHTYVTDLNHFLFELDEGHFIHQNLETVFIDIEGKQLLCEALFLYGLMLLLVDAYIEGSVRERLLVSYYRYLPQRGDVQTKIDDVCKLLRETGLSSGKKPATYPEEYFRRVGVSATYIEIVIGHLRTGDLYDQLAAFPLPRHRSHALSQQAGMLYVCLYFAPTILHTKTGIMREIVDKYFPDNWSISLYMGFIVNLVEGWDAFKAAKQALTQTVESAHVRSIAAGHHSGIAALQTRLDKALTDGTLTRDSLLPNIAQLINLLRDANCTIRWLMLHTTCTASRVKRARQATEAVQAEVGGDFKQPLFGLLLQTAQLEARTRDLYRALLREKADTWAGLKAESERSLRELGDAFGGAKPLARVPKNANLQRWFGEIGREVAGLSAADPNAPRTIVQLLRALEEVQEYHSLGSSLQVVQCLTETRRRLDTMARTLHLREDVLVTLQIVADLGYGWVAIDAFTPLMQAGVAADPRLVGELRALFQKLASALEPPLVRINQARSGDLRSVSEYFSAELEVYVRRVLQIIPTMVFGRLERIIEMQTNSFRELPARLDKDKLREFAQLEQRVEFGALLREIATCAQGMRAMRATLVGVVRLDPQRLLDDGIRRELVRRVAGCLHERLVFGAKLRSGEFGEKLAGLAKVMDGYKRSFEYIQDHVAMNGLLIWQEEVTRIVNFNVEVECGRFLRGAAVRSEFQNRHVPIPEFAPVDASSCNWVGRLAREIIRVTDPKGAFYVSAQASWFCGKTQRAVFGREAVRLLGESIEIAGLVGLDRFFGFMIAVNLRKIVEFLEAGNGSITCSNILRNVCGEIESPSKLGRLDAGGGLKLLQNCVNRSGRIWTTFLDLVLLVGQLQLLRRLIAYHLRATAKLKAKGLELSLQALNDALMYDMVHEKLTPDENFLEKVSTCFNFMGQFEPFNTIYLTTKFDEKHAITLFVFFISHLSKCFFMFPINLSRRRQFTDSIDSAALTIGLHTIIKQFHNYLNVNFIKYLSIYIKQLVHQKTSGNINELPPEIDYVLTFFEEYAGYSAFSRKVKRETFSDEFGHLLHILLGPT